MTSWTGREAASCSAVNSQLLPNHTMVGAM